MQSKTEE